MYSFVPLFNSQRHVMLCHFIFYTLFSPDSSLFTIVFFISISSYQSFHNLLITRQTHFLIFQGLMRIVGLDKQGRKRKRKDI
ncbi:hypothetical protein J3Q64DRAFT_1724539 [Phycomyces blakesleeanus]|uniref:Uncharacterized protein n=1 Tax=Phycomyces blakesleeanus TaxID=4837 RepID=A0ABR3BA09_PHYBL